MGEAMLQQFTGLTKTRYDAGEAQTKLQQTWVRPTDPNPTWFQETSSLLVRIGDGIPTMRSPRVVSFV